MANLRKIKKDIDFLVDEVLTDCTLYVEFHPNEKVDEVEAILLDTVNLRNELYSRVNAKPAEGAKAHYTAISKDLLEGVDKLFTRISELNTAGK